MQQQEKLQRKEDHGEWRCWTSGGLILVPPRAAWRGGLGDAPPNSEKSSGFFFGAAISVSKTAPLSFATAFFAFYGGGGENGLPKGLAPLFALPGGLSRTRGGLLGAFRGLLLRA